MACFESAKHPQDAATLDREFPTCVVDGEVTEYTAMALVRSMIAGKPVTITHRIRPDLCRRLMHEILARFGTAFDAVLIEGIHMFEMYDLLREHMPGVPLVLRQANAEYVIMTRTAQTTAHPMKRWVLDSQSRLMRRYEERALTCCDGVTFISEVDSAFFQHLNLPNGAFIASPGVAIPESHNQPRQATRLLALASWKWAPNQEGLRWFLSEVWPELHALHPECSLDIVGSGFPQNAVIDRYPDHITYHGFVDDITPFLHNSAAMIFPLFSGSGIKIKLLEAMAYALPVITTPLAAEGIAINPGEHYLSAETRHDFTTAIARVLAAPHEAQQIGRNARARMQEAFSWEHRSQALTAYLNRCIGA